MRTADVVVLTDYVYWMRDRILSAAAELPEGAFASPATMTNRTLRATLVHELDVEWSWRERLRTGEFPEDEDLDPEGYASLAELRVHWERDEVRMRAWVAGLSDAELAAPPPGEQHPLPLWYFVMHLLTHAVQQFSEAAVLLTAADRSPGDIGFLEFALAQRAD